MKLTSIPKECSHCDGELETKREIIPNRLRQVICVMFGMAGIILCIIFMSTFFDGDSDDRSNPILSTYELMSLEKTGIFGAMIVSVIGLRLTRKMPDKVRLKCKKCRQLNEFKVVFTRE